MHGNHELLAVKQRVVVRICHGASNSQVGARLILTSPEKQQSEEKNLLVIADVKHS